MGIAERRLREKEARRTTILNAAEEVFFSKGVEKATMDDVAEKAELSKGLLYFYFRSKQDLGHAIAHRGLSVLEGMFREVLATEKNGLSQARAMGEAYVRFSREYSDYFNMVSWVQMQSAEESDPGSFAERCEMEGDACIELVATAVQNGIADGTIRSDLNPLETALSLWAQTHGLIGIIAFKEVKGRYQVDPNRLLTSSLDLITRGLTAHPGRFAISEN